MANRSVYVELKLQTDRYKAEAEAAARATEGLDRKVSDTDRDLKKIPRSAAEAAAAMKLLGAEGDATRLKMEDGFGRSSTSLEMLDQKLVAARAEVRRLADEFNRTGDSGILTKPFEADDATKELEKLKARITSSLGDAGDDGGRSFMSRLTGSVGQGSSSFVTALSNVPWVGAIFKPVASAMGSLPPQIQAGVAAAVVAGIVGSAAAIGAALNGALLTGIGLGGLGLGVVGQLHNPMVHAAFAEMGRDLSLELDVATRSFGGPLVLAAHTLGDALRGELGSIDFGKLASAIGPLAHGLAGLVSAMGPGLNGAFAASVPLLKELAGLLPSLGHALGQFFHDLAANPQGAASGLRLIMILLETLIVIAGQAIGFLTRAWEIITNVGEAVTGFAADVLGWMPIFGAWLEKVHSIWVALKSGDVSGAVDQMGSFGDATAAAAASAGQLDTALGGVGTVAQRVSGYLADMNDVLDATFNKHMAAATAALQTRDSLDALGQSIRQNGDHWDLNSAAGRRNEQALLSVLDAAERERQANVANGMDAAAAARKFDDEATAAFNMAAGAGLAKTELDKLKGQYLVNIQEVINIITNANRQGKVSNTLDRLGGARASGGPVVGGRAYIVGEHRPEMFVPDTDGMIVPSVPRGVDYAGMRSMTVPAATGAQSLNLTLSVAPGGSPADQAFVTGAAYAIRSGALVLSAGGDRVTVS